MFNAGGKLHWVKNLCLRLRYGGGCCDVYSLNFYLAKKILPPLKVFRQKICSYPNDMTPKEWENALDDMIYAFDALIKDDGYERDERMERGLELFGKHFQSLWK